MESHIAENKNGGYPTDATTIPSVTSSSGGVPPPVIGWSEEFECETIDGVLSPCPISTLITKTRLDENKPQPESSISVSRKKGSGSASKMENELESSKKKRRTEGIEEIFFKLFKFEKPKEYILEMHEPKTGLSERSHLIVDESDGKWKIGTSDPTEGMRCVVPVVEDPSPPKVAEKYQFSLQERLTGWTVEIRRRTNGKEDKFYYHHGKQFRSFVEVMTFILYSCKSKDLKTTNQDSVEAEAAEAMVSISSQGKSTAEPAKPELGEPPQQSNDNENPVLEVDVNAPASEEAVPNEGGTTEVVRGGPNKPEEIEENPFMDFCEIFDDVAGHNFPDIFRN